MIEDNFPKRLYLPESGTFDRIVKRVEEIMFSVILIVMILIGLAPILMRYFGMMSFSWTESLSQHMVLWIALLGAGTAIRERTSISIDVIPHLLGPRKQIFLRAITELISAVICGILVWISFNYVRSILEFDRETVAFLKVPEWLLSTVMPFGFFLLTLRLLIAAIEDIVISYSIKPETENHVKIPDAVNNTPEQELMK